MPLECRYCGLVFWSSQDETSHPIPCRPGAAPGSATVGVPPGEIAAPDPVAGDAVLPPDTAAQGLLETGS